MIPSTIIKKCLRGNQLAFKQAYNSSLPYVLSIVSRYIYDQSDRPDVVQDVYIQLFNNLEKFDESRGTIRTFIRIITVNRCITHLKKQSNKPIVQTLSVIDEQHISTKGENQLLELSKEDIMVLLQDMPQGYKVVFLLFVFDDFSHKEIAEQLDISPETSRSQYSRAKKWLLKHYADSTIINSYGIFR